MAEGLLRCLAKGNVETFSAGTEATKVRPEAISVMAELGIDISDHTSKSMDGFIQQEFDYVITVCEDANKDCPVFPQASKRLHWSIEDPSQVVGGKELRLQAFRESRDGLLARIKSEFLA